MVANKYQSPNFTKQDACRIAKEQYGLQVEAHQLPGEHDQNFYLKTSNEKEFVLKISCSTEERALLELQNKVMELLEKDAHSLSIPKVYASKSKKTITEVSDNRGVSYLVRLLTFVPGKLLAHVKPHTPKLLHSLGRVLGTIDTSLLEFDHPAAHRILKWDLAQAGWIREYTQYIEQPARRTIVEKFLEQFEKYSVGKLSKTRSSVIYNDANDYNVLVSDDDPAQCTVAGVIDFGDLVYTHTICEPAIASAYAMMGKADPIPAAAHIVRGYHQVLSLTPEELELLFPLICIRLCITATNAAYQRTHEPDNKYLTISEQPAWILLEKLAKVNPQFAHRTFRTACDMPAYPAANKTAGQPLENCCNTSGMEAEEILALRHKFIGKSLSIAYQKPLHIVRGSMQYLYDEQGRRFLDCVNNVAHVGHSHPRVVKAGQSQMAVLNTNTRYLHENLVRYAKQLCSTLPQPLSVSYFVCSGSEANELALRLARSHTGQKDLIVLDVSYHGNTTTLVDISPYKHDGPGGFGTPSYVHKVPTPDVYRGLYKKNDPLAGEKYAAHIAETIERIHQKDSRLSAFIGEPIMGCAGQIVLPEGYLKEAYLQVRNAGGVCIADEVQVGFGRAGTHFWAFETQGVVPDIVTLGKPAGNGHPLAAVITTPEIAASFANGMEYFNTFGGNPVSCAIGMAVLDVIAEEHLQENALEVGNYLINSLGELMKKHSIIGDVRGLGLFIGVELVSDRKTLEPAGEQAACLINLMKEHGILLSTDGPFHNVIKIKPPLVFTRENAGFLVSTLDKVLENDLFNV